MSRLRAPGAAPGQVPTPAGLARTLVRALSGLLPSADGGPAPLLLDPSCGPGALLAAARDGIRAGELPADTGLAGIELDPALVDRAREFLGPGVDLRQGDALERPWPAGSWILANPPWTSFSGRAARGGPPAAAHPPGGWPALHACFLERIARHVATEGTGAAVLLPASVASHARYAPTRRAVEEAGARLAAPPRDLGEEAFPGVDAPAVLVLLVPARGARPSPDWQPLPPWLEALESFPRPPARSFGDPGVHSGNAARRLVRPLDEEHLPGLRQGRDLAPFALGPPSARLDVHLSPGPDLRFRHAPLERYRAVPVLLRQTADRPRAALHRDPTYFRNSLLAGYGWEGMDPAALVALLNGPVATAFHRARFADGRQRVFPQVKVGHLQALPLPFLRRDEAPALHDELARRARFLSEAEGPAALRERAALERRTLAAYGLPRAVLERVIEGAAP